MSEYLFKILQPTLDDALYLGKSYEASFDRFEVLLALVIADLRVRRGGHLWAPMGRFGWIQQAADDNAPLSQVINEARTKGEDWGPITNGLFYGSMERFEAVADDFLKKVNKLGWH